MILNDHKSLPQDQPMTGRKRSHPTNDSLISCNLGFSANLIQDPALSAVEE